MYQKPEPKNKKNKDGKIISISREVELRNLELEKINNELMMFSYAVTHDLKQPARLLKVYFDMMKKTLEPKMDEREKEFFGMMYNNSKLMLDMLESLNEFSTLDKIKKQKENVDLNAILNETIATLELDIIQSDVTLNISRMPEIESYSILFKRLFLNLIHNSIKYSRKDSKCFIDIKYKNEDGKNIITIIDNGIGIPQNQQKNIFQIFKRASNHKNIEGSGVGLAYCNKIMTMLNGSIEIFSEGENMGTTVTLSF